MNGPVIVTCPRCRSKATQAACGESWCYCRAGGTRMTVACQDCGSGPVVEVHGGTHCRACGSLRCGCGAKSPVGAALPRCPACCKKDWAAFTAGRAVR